MSFWEFIAVAFVVLASLAYLVRRAWMLRAAKRAGCCGGCPVGTEKIRLAANGTRVSTKS